MNQIFCVSTFFGAMTVAAAIDAGQFDEPGVRNRVLLVSTNTPIPEASTPVHAQPGFDVVAKRFDIVRDWNEIIQPFHPAQFTDIGEPAVANRWLKSHLGLDQSPVHLVLESIQVSPARTLVDTFVDARVTLYSDGLMSYGPTRVALPNTVGTRIERLVHLDLVPGVAPVLLLEFGVASEPIADVHARAVFEQVANTLDLESAVDGLPEPGRSALILGQYLSALDLVSIDEEVDLYRSMIDRAFAAGCDAVVFKPHPSAPAVVSEQLADDFVEGDGHFFVHRSPLSLELLLTEWAPRQVVGCFSTGLVTAHRFFGVDVATCGVDVMLERLMPVENSNRIPLVLIDALIKPLRDPSVDDEPSPSWLGWAQPNLVQCRIEVVGYAMQPGLLDDLRPEVVNEIESRGLHTFERYIPHRRAVQLRLPGVTRTRNQALKDGWYRRLDAADAWARRQPFLARPLFQGQRAAKRVASTAERSPRLRPIVRRMRRPRF